MSSSCSPSQSRGRHRQFLCSLRWATRRVWPKQAAGGGWAAQGTHVIKSGASADLHQPRTSPASSMPRVKLYRCGRLIKHSWQGSARATHRLMSCSLSQQAVLWCKPSAERRACGTRRCGKDAHPLKAGHRQEVERVPGCARCSAAAFSCGFLHAPVA